eukprot:4279598-Pyramimonas_sp.AAC.1
MHVLSLALAQHWRHATDALAFAVSGTLLRNDAGDHWRPTRCARVSATSNSIPVALLMLLLVRIAPRAHLNYLAAALALSVMKYQFGAAALARSALPADAAL